MNEEEPPLFIKGVDIAKGESTTVWAMYKNGIYHIIGETKMIEKFELDELGNDNLIQQSKNCNGALYTRINRLQRDLNIANAEVERLKKTSCSEHHDWYKEAHTQADMLRDEQAHHNKTIEELTNLKIKLKKIQEAIEAFKS